MNVGHILETGYVIYDGDRDDFYTANTGIFRTQRNAEKICNRWNKVYGRNLKVLKVNLVIAED